METSRGEWSSKLGFILAGAGSAIGLGNIWRFPYVVGQNGGAAFVLLYLFFVVIIGLPYMFAELAMGRATQRNPVGAIGTIKPRSLWKGTGYLAVLTALGILSFYAVIAGWTVGYIAKMLTGRTGGFAGFISDPLLVILLLALFLALTALIVHGGVARGIERWSKVLMPLLFFILLGLVVYAVTLKGASAGLSFYLKPDFSKITGATLLAALGQAFFSLSLGMGIIVTYGSYVSKKDNLVTSGFFIALFDTIIAIMAGLVIFPALFAMGQSPSSGPTLVFEVLPALFAKMPGGLVVGGFFFLLLSIAALTSTISLLEVPVSYLADERKLSRRSMVWAAAFAAFLIALPSALSQGASGFFTNFGLLPERLTSADFLGHMSFVFGDVSLALGAFLMSLFIGWVWGARRAADEIQSGSPGFARARTVWIFMIRFFIPAVIFVILLNLFGIFG